MMKQEIRDTEWEMTGLLLLRKNQPQV